MEDNFNLEIISPSKLELKNETNSVVIPSYEGYMNILKDHINLITFLKVKSLLLIKSTPL